MCFLELDQFRPGENTPRLSEKFIAWAKIVQKAGSFFVLAKILSLGLEYLIAWVKYFTPRRKHSREHTCSKGFLT